MADIIEKTTVTFDSFDLEGVVNANVVKIKLDSNGVLYKTSTMIRSVDIAVTPDEITGVSSVDLIETENMEGFHEYHFNFGNGVEYKGSVPNVGVVNFFDIPNLQRSEHDRDFPFHSSRYKVNITS